MRSTLEILLAVKERRPATEEELRLALLATCGIEHFVRGQLRKLVEAVEAGKGPAYLALLGRFARDTLERTSRARAADPAAWLGPSGTPGNPEHDRLYAAGLRLLERLSERRDARGEGGGDAAEA